MQEHSWREQGEEETRIYRATHHAGRWKILSQVKGEEEWTTHDPIERKDWVRLREILWRKYQRKRLPWKLIEQIDKLLEDESEGDGD